MAEFVKHALAEQVATITIDRPELHNAFNEALMRELTEAFTSLGHDKNVRAIILAAEGKSFCAGADLNWMKRMVDYSFEENVADAGVMANMLLTIHDCPKPVIARVHGPAYGGGVGLIAAADMAVASHNATFCLSEVKLGIVPAVISPYVMEKIGAGPCRRYALTAERFTAGEAHRIGLISEVTSEVDALDQAIADITKAVRGNGPKAVNACKSIIAEVHGFTWDALTDITTRHIAERRVSPEGQEGIKAFLEKRMPDWTT